MDERGFGYEYAADLVMTGVVDPNTPVDIDKMCSETVSIPDGDYTAMKAAGIENPSALEYWRGYNDFMNGQ